MEKSKELDDILQDIESTRIAKQTEQKHLKETLENAQTVPSIEQTRQKRNEKVQSFTLDVDLDGTIPDDVAQEQPVSADGEVRKTPICIDETENISMKKPKKKKSGCLGKVLYVAIITIAAVLISYFALVFLIDAVGINQPSTLIDVEVPQGASTQQIAQILADKGVIRNPLCFRIYSRLTGSDGKYQLGMFTLSADMGYTDIVDKLQTATPKATVNVTIPEGFTVEEIAKLLSEKEVCDKESFYEAVAYGEFDYDFIRAIPTAEDGAEHVGRIYRLEGYLFPDTYNFYTNSSGQYAVGVMLANFDKKVDAVMRAQIAEMDMTLDEAVIMASIIQGEAASFEDMTGVSRVFFNRMQEGSGFPKLESCATRDYVKGILPSLSGVAVTSAAYNTYERVGLPVGAINNPGLDAFKALLHPSEDPDMMQCYFFATDYDTGMTYFSKTFAQHEAICRKYKIGAYG